MDAVPYKNRITKPACGMCEKAGGTPVIKFRAMGSRGNATATATAAETTTTDN